MKKTIMTTIILGMFLLSLASAYDINLKGGESVTLTLLENYDYYEITDNITPMEGLNISKVNDTNDVLIYADFLTEGYFTITFYKGEEEIESPGSSSGGGICYRAWKTENWNECKDNIRTRTVKYDYSKCYNTKQVKPETEKTCEIEVKEEPQQDVSSEIQEPQNKSNFWYIVIIAIVIILFIGLLVYWLIK